MLTPEERVLRARIAANTRWAREADRPGATEKARKASNDRFLNQVPAEITDPAQRAKCAENLRRAFYQKMAYRSAQVRRRRDVVGAAQVVTGDSLLERSDAIKARHAALVDRLPSTGDDLKEAS